MLSVMDGHGCYHLAVLCDASHSHFWCYTKAKNEHKLLLMFLMWFLKDQRNKLSLNPKLSLTKEGSYDKWTEGQIQTVSSIFVRRGFKSTTGNDWLCEAGKVKCETMKWVQHEGFESSLTPLFSPPLIPHLSDLSTFSVTLRCGEMQTKFPGTFFLPRKKKYCQNVPGTPDGKWFNLF